MAFSIARCACFVRVRGDGESLLWLPSLPSLCGIKRYGWVIPKNLAAEFFDIHRERVLVIYVCFLEEGGCGVSFQARVSVQSAASGRQNLPADKWVFARVWLLVYRLKWSLCCQRERLRRRIKQNKMEKNKTTRFGRKKKNVNSFRSLFSFLFLFLARTSECVVFLSSDASS